LQIPRDPNLHVWADIATTDLVQKFYIQNGLQFTKGWAFAQGTDVLVDAVRRSNGVRFLPHLQTLVNNFESSAYSPYKPLFTDDHAWMGIAFARMADLMLHLPGQEAMASRALAASLTEFAKVTPMEDRQSENSQGMWWTAARHEKNTAANAPSVKLACLLYNLQNKPEMLDFAQRVYQYWRSIALDTNTGRVIDTQNHDLSISDAQFTYNYGTMIGASLCLHEATGLSIYRDDALLMGAYMLSHFSVVAGMDHVLNERVCLDGCAGDLGLFKGIGARYLAELAEHQPENETLQALLDDSAHTLGTTFLMTPTRQIGGVWQRPAKTEDAQNGQTSGAMLLNTLADSAIGVPRPQSFATLYEAEDAVLSNLSTTTTNSTAADNAIFSGSGYVSFVPQSGSSITFSVERVINMAIRLTFHYRSPSGTATRLFRVGSGTNTTTVKFIRTPSSGALGEISLVLPAAPPGLQALTLAVDPGADFSAQGNIALDSLTLAYLPPKATALAIGSLPLPLQPPDGSGVCESLRFAWDVVAQAYEYVVVVDGVRVASVQGTSTDITLPALAAGSHTWYVLALRPDGVLVGPKSSFRYASQQVPVPGDITMNDTSAGLKISWVTAPLASQALAHVTFQGTTRCSRLHMSSCIIEGVNLSDTNPGDITVRLQNSCGFRETVAP
jgi:predicted alpha-1,6-mannanase (GH76 family)